VLGVVDVDFVGICLVHQDFFTPFLVSFYLSLFDRSNDSLSAEKKIEETNGVVSETE